MWGIQKNRSMLNNYQINVARCHCCSLSALMSGNLIPDLPTAHLGKSSPQAQLLPFRAETLNP